VRILRLVNATLAGTNMIFRVTHGVPGGAYDVVTSTNIALPLMNWRVLISGNFDWLSSATITNGINFTEPQHYFSVRQP